jgi:hypothetical protein
MSSPDLVPGCGAVGIWELSGESNSAAAVRKIKFGLLELRPIKARYFDIMHGETAHEYKRELMEAAFNESCKHRRLPANSHRFVVPAACLFSSPFTLTKSSRGLGATIPLRRIRVCSAFPRLAPARP